LGIAEVDPSLMMAIFSGEDPDQSQWASRLPKAASW
jgi:hypothetical protein